MNQILNVENNQETDKKDSNIHSNTILYKISLFKFQLAISLIVISIICFLYFYYQYSRNNQEKISTKLVNNYNISRLYSNQSNSINTYGQNNSEFSVIGLIEIPKIKISYPVLSNFNDELLKIAPCKISGPTAGSFGNLCIAGHNYDNYKFFSNISNLNNDDEIIIYDSYGNKFSYFVFNIYEVLEDNLSPLNNSMDYAKVTLITCNNSNSKRIIVEAKMI